MKTFLVTSLFLTLSVSGCSLLKPREGITLQDKVMAVEGSARVGTFLAITQAKKDKPEEQVKVARTIVSSTDTALAIIGNPDFVNNPDNATREGITRLIALVPIEYRSFVMVGLQTFETYYVLPNIGQVLTPEQAALLDALFRGIRGGAMDVININQEVTND